MNRCVVQYRKIHEGNPRDVVKLRQLLDLADERIRWQDREISEKDRKIMEGSPSHVVKLQQLLDLAKELIREQDREISEKDSEISQKVRAMGEIQTGLELAQSKNDEHPTHILCLDSDITNLKDEITNLKDHIEDLKHDKDKLRLRIRYLKDKMYFLE